MITIRKADQRGRTNIGWLDSRHSFSFGQYYDPKHMGFRSLRVINDDRVAPAHGFGEHPHRDMEILSYVVDGGLCHQDSEGSQSVIRHGTIQKMSAGSGITHSEYNASQTDPVHFLQVWIEPDQDNLKPAYEENSFDVVPSDSLHLIASPDENNEGVQIHQDAFVYSGLLTPGAKRTVLLSEARYGWLQMINGTLLVNGKILNEGDGAQFENESTIAIESKTSAEFLFFDLA